MRLMLPTGDDGALRAYVLDGIMDLSRVTLNETIELHRATGLGLQQVNRGFAMLDAMIGVSDEALIVAMSTHLELMEAYRALVWLARYRAGDRAPDRSVLTAEAAVDFPFSGIDIEFDPGDTDEDPPDPPKPSRAGGRGTAGGTKTRSKPGGRSSTTSAGKS